jgi:hypothetical protein
MSEGGISILSDRFHQIQENTLRTAVDGSHKEGADEK